MSPPPKTGAATPPIRAGVGLRPRHHQRVRDERPAVAWFEVHAENFMAGGMLAEDLDDIAQAYPISLHAIGLSLGSATDADDAHAHAHALRRLIERYSPCLVSDHLSWSETDGAHLPDLLPLPYSEEALEVTARNIERVQEIIQRPLLIENPSLYLEPSGSLMSESEFLAKLCARTGCGVLLDVNNIFVTAHNLGRDASQTLGAYTEALPHTAIGEIHLAGHAEVRLRSGATARIDDHGSAVREEVWRLYRRLIAAIGPRPTLIEWDTNIPGLDVLMAEAASAQAILDVHAKEPLHAVAC